LCKETHGTTIRIAPPLVIEREEIDWAFERIEKVLEYGRGAILKGSFSPPQRSWKKASKQDDRS
jgi:hypothetical protein